MSKYVKLTQREFDLISDEIESSYSQHGCMDEEAAERAYKAWKAMQNANKRNGIARKKFIGNESVSRLYD